MGWFSVDSDQAQAYDEIKNAPHNAELSYELVGNAAAYEAATMYEDHVANNGQPDSNAEAEEILKSFIGVVVDRQVETMRLDSGDKQKAEVFGLQQVEEARKMNE
ncbi:hypothetical protein N7510_007320 [Penicillium lagena]|uniref:uncharacterized protein n=1 Tax=Penicillium lagena TaxID=94218 RepID=UPI0025417290|nr:uncharacterized protein N7510_007320 [Penicillium lagena]KAJ5610601.1 hypothetical protein N7510_007320 [Penicillium lagena]